MRSLRLAALVAVALPLALPPALPAQEPVDTHAVRLIREEAFDRSQIMDIASWLTDVYGPRLTGSPIARAGGEWAVTRLTTWGLKDARLEPWGYFGRGWTNERTSVQVTAPTPFPVIAYPAAWTPGTRGPVSARVVMLEAEDSVTLERYRGRLRGAVVMLGPTREVPALWQPLAQRLSTERLDSMAALPAPRPGGGGGGPMANPEARARMLAAQQFTQFRTRFLVEEGVAAVLQPGRGDGGNVFVGGGGSRDPATPSALPILVTAIEHYGRIARTLEKGIEVRMDLDVRNTFHDDDLDSWNVLAEIPGTDKADEVVMLGAHFDTWHGGTGATDNTAGSAVMMEAVRILKALNLPMRAHAPTCGRSSARRTSRRRPMGGSRSTSTWTTAPAPFAACTSRGTRRSGRSSRRG
jgi:carboxypeptidase Q